MGFNVVEILQGNHMDINNKPPPPQTILTTVLVICDWIPGIHQLVRNILINCMDDAHVVNKNMINSFNNSDDEAGSGNGICLGIGVTFVCCWTAIGSSSLLFSRIFTAVS